MLGPRNMDARKVSSTLQHQHSTKQLINRFESLTCDSPASQLAHFTSRVPIVSPSGPLALQKPASPASSRKADKSPIRQSFRNFLSVFRKGSGLNKVKSEDSVVSSTRYRPSKQPPPELLASIDDPSILPNESAPCPAPTRYSGPLLYLSRFSDSPSDSSVLPVWITCIATLEGDHILISWLTTHGNPSTHSIPLVHCADVRSLSLNQIGPDERALLPRKGNVEESRVFEILFEGRPREKFAATCVQERAGWVSAIWDAVLSQGPKDISHIEHNSLVMAVVDADLSDVSVAARRLEYPLSTPVSQIKTSTDPHALPYYPERSLPPTPADTAPQSVQTPTRRTTLHDATQQLPPVSPSLYSPTRPVSPTTSLSLSPLPSTYSRSKRPSVANLGQLSVVKQRLAQIERNLSQPSTPHLSSPYLSSRSTGRTQVTTPVLSGRARMEKPLPDIEKLQYTRSPRSNGEESLLDADGDTTLHDCRAQKSQHSPTQHPFASTQEPRTDQLAPPLRSEFPLDHGLQPLIELLQDQAANHYDQTANLGDQILSLQRDVNNIPRDLVSLVGEKSGKPELDNIHQIVLSLDQRSQGTREELKWMHEKMDDLGEHMKQQVPSNPENPPSHSTGEIASILETLEAMRVQLGSNFPVVLRDLAEIQGARIPQGNDNWCDGDPITVMSNLKPSSFSDRDSAGAKNSATASPIDFSGVHAKLDGLLTLYTATAKGENGVNHEDRSEGQTQLTEIVALLKEDGNRSTLQAQQQADSVRYLNELNCWLESFVSNGTSQIDVVAASVERLRKELGCGSGSSVPGAYSDGDRSLSADIRQLLVETRARDQSAEILQASMNNLAAVITDDLRKNADSQNVFTPESVIGLIDRQRHDQEGLLRALTTELSNEIRGERLRFVEAMKEATVINVQVHVEQFKKELTREVLGMTQEVGRLHRERQAIENQIADLFAFYSKQKQAGAPFVIPAIPQTRSQQQTIGQQHRPSSQLRSLPNPRGP